MLLSKSKTLLGRGVGKKRPLKGNGIHYIYPLKFASYSVGINVRDIELLQFL